MNIQIPYVRCLEQTNKVYAIEVDLTNCDAITDNAALRDTLTKIYSSLQKTFWPRAIHIRNLLVPAHNISGSSIMDLNPKNPLAPITQQLCVLDFSRTNCSAAALLSLDIFPNLVEARFDGCKNLKLLNMPAPATVQRLSLLDTKIHARFLQGILTTFPNLRAMRVTLYPTMHYPLGFANWMAHSYPQVALDGGNFTLMKDRPTLTLKKLNVEFCREEDGWKVIPLDVNKTHLIAGKPCFIHTRCTQLHSVEPADGICTACKEQVDDDTLRPFHQALDSTLDFQTAFEPLPGRPAPRTPWEIIERSLEYQNME